MKNKFCKLPTPPAKAWGYYKIENFMYKKYLYFLVSTAI